MKSYLSIIPISAKVHRRQNKMTILCISIAVFMITAVFSMADMAVRQETARLVAKHGSGAIKDFFASQSAQSVFPIAIALFVFVLIAGILMIAGSLNSSVAQKTKFFGMLRCIGMSKKQVIRYVRLEALNQCKTAIPAGLVLGMAATWAMCAVLKFGVGGEWSDMPQLKLSVIGIVSGTLVGLLTVLIAAGKPARNAAKVSPVAAVSGGTCDAESKAALGVRGMKIENALGVSHAVKSKKNLFLMIGSFALSIILFLSFSVFIDLVNCLMPQSENAAEIEIWSADNENSLDFALLDKLSGAQGVERAFARRATFDVKVECEDASIKTADIISYGDFDIECLRKDGMLERGSDIESVISGGNFALLISDGNIEKDDKISAFGEEISVAGKLKYDPFSADGSTEGKTTLIISDTLFEKLTGTGDYSMILIQLNNDATDESVEAIKSIVGAAGIVNDYREDDNHGTYVAFLVCVFSFLTIIAMVTVLNIVNSISMSVSAKMKQYGAMRAVGMSEKQLKKMITAEALTYAVLGCVIGLVLGVGLSKWLYGFLVTSHFPYAIWSLPLTELAVTVLFFILSVIAGVYSPIKRIKAMSITETINEL